MNKNKRTETGSLLNNFPKKKVQKEIFESSEENFSLHLESVSYPPVTSPTNPALSTESVRENRLLIEQLMNIRIDEIVPENGEYLRLSKFSYSNDYDLTEHFL